MVTKVQWSISSSRDETTKKKSKLFLKEELKKKQKRKMVQMGLFDSEDEGDERELVDHMLTCVLRNPSIWNLQQLGSHDG